jgi:DNA repair protein RadC
MANTKKTLTKEELINQLKALEVAEPTKKITNPESVFALVSDILDKKQEHFVVITLDGANKVVNKHVLFIGTLNASLVHPREVFAAAIEDRAASIILSHNHPSGQLVPSREDIAITQRLKSGGEILGIEVLDHIIVTTSGYYSMKMCSDF